MSNPREGKNVARPIDLHNRRLRRKTIKITLGSREEGGGRMSREFEIRVLAGCGWVLKLCALGVCSCMSGALLCFSAHLYDGAELELSEHPVSEEVVHLPTLRQGAMQQSIPETPRCRQTRRATGGVQMRHLRAGVLLA